MPASVDEGDELFLNGIFEFNITKMLQFINDNKDKIVLESIAVKDYRDSVSRLDE
jgi:hypothetical protein